MSKKGCSLPAQQTIKAQYLFSTSIEVRVIDSAGVLMHIMKLKLLGLLF